MLTTEQKIMMAYAILRVAIDEISNLTGKDPFGNGNDLCDAISIARKAKNAVDSLKLEDVEK